MWTPCCVGMVNGGGWRGDEGVLGLNVTQGGRTDMTDCIDIYATCID